MEDTTHGLFMKAKSSSGVSHQGKVSSPLAVRSKEGAFPIYNSRCHEILILEAQADKVHGNVSTVTFVLHLGFAILTGTKS